MPTIHLYRTTRTLLDVLIVRRQNLNIADSGRLVTLVKLELYRNIGVEVVVSDLASEA
jgi:hypothetical protein